MLFTIVADPRVRVGRPLSQEDVQATFKAHGLLPFEA